MSVEKQVSHYIRIKRFDTNAVVEQLTATSQSEAERIQRGVLINLNHSEYYVTIVPVQASEAPAETESELHKRWRENANMPHVGVSGDGTVHIILPPEVAKRMGAALINSPGLATGREDELTPLQLITRHMVNALDQIHGDGWEKKQQ